jgi:uncharacterized phage-like protein YoqJ
MANRQNTLCFSGHRYYDGSEADQVRLADSLLAACEAGYRTFISGMAQGFDLAAAEAVLRLRSAGLFTGIELVCAVPFPRQASKYSPVDRLRYDAALAAADLVKVLSDRYSHGCYYRRDDWMVDRSGRIVCWYDGSSSGTRYTVRRAVASGLEVVNLFRDPNGTLF